MRGGRKIFNEEKVLYFASQEQSFHVQPNEPRDSDCSRIVRHLVTRGCLELAEEGAGGRFYSITDKGRATLLKMQIEWRRRNHKDTDAHEAELKQIEGQL